MWQPAGSVESDLERLDTAQILSYLSEALEERTVVGALSIIGSAFCRPSKGVTLVFSTY